MIERDLIDYLATLETPAQDRVFPLIVPQGENFPALSVKLSSKVREETQTTLTGDLTATFQVKCETKSNDPQAAYWACKSIIESLVSGINSYEDGQITGVYSIAVGTEADDEFYYLDGNTYGIQPITLEITLYYRG